VRRLSWLIKLSLVVVVSGLGLAAVTAGIIPHVVQALHAHEQDPITLPPFSDLAQRSYVYDLAGNTIAFFELENSQPVKVDQVPQLVIQAVLAVEDSEFYLHKGVNVRSLARAILADVQTGSSRQGASTITMQLAKLEYLANFDQDARYKLIQARYALMLEKQLTKDQILERYLNVVYFGANAYGIQAAAEVYFGKQAKDLTMLEGAFLAGLIRAPSSYNPIENPEQSKARFKTVVRRLVDEKMLTEADGLTAYETFELPEIAQRTPELPSARTHFTNEVKDFLLNRSTILGDTYEARFNALFRGGLSVYTTLDPNIQQMANDAKNAQLPANAAGIEAAMTVLDTTSGAVRAMVGGKEFEKDVNEVNLALRPRQTGSSIKLFILAAAIQAGAQGNDIIDGTKPCELPNPGNPREPFIIKGGVSKAPATLAEMTWSSINCAYARLSQIVGLNRLVISTYRMARSPWLIGDKENDGRVIEAFASYATGANEMSSLDMAAGGQTIANRGLHQEPYIIERIESPRGLVYQHQLVGTQVLDPDVADQTVAILKGVITRGTARKAMEGGLQGGDRPAAGKTGTQDKNTNAWFVGFTPQLTAAVWVGDPNGYTQMDGIPEFVAAGVPKVQGGTFPARIWKAMMEPAHYGLPIVDWPAPPPPERPAARLYLPGNECLAKGAAVAPPVDPAAPVDPNAPPVVVGNPVKVDPGTTVSPSNLDPNAPLPTVALNGVLVYECKRGLPVAAPPSTAAPAEAPPTTAPEAPPGT
jgi:penicillin-binding protein 1A